MKILVLNSGSSSIKYKVFRFEDLSEIYEGVKEEVKDHLKALVAVIEDLIEEDIITHFDDIKVVGHRVVHGGDYFDAPVIVDEKVRKKIEELSTLAPLHNPANLAGIEAIGEYSAHTPQVAVFDTAFHHTIPKPAHTYALPYVYYEKYGIKRYGFHGTSHNYVALQAAKQLGKKFKEINLITVHLGGGASVCAIERGKSVETSMGFTPLEGLMMGTRCGDIDSSLIFYLKKQTGMSDEKIEQVLNKQSGLKGICGLSDLREIQKLYETGFDKAILAVEMFVHRVKKYIGAYMMILGQVDAVVLTGGIGEHSDLVDDSISKSLEVYNLKVLKIKTNEELAIAKASKKLISNLDREVNR
jgi:acetate kinase